MKSPKIVGLILCRKFDVDSQLRETSLVGIFQARHFRRFPSPEQSFTVYSALYDGEGEGTIELVVTRLETEQDIYSHKRWYTLPGRGMILNVVVPVRQLVFPAPGRYALRLLFDKVELGIRVMDVFSRLGGEA